ncbi:MAG: hypothetical protein ABIJ41_03205 [Candidatus Omnitrophota bacterium]
MLYSLLRKRKKKGFTVVEALLAASMMAVVGLALYQALSSGLKIWDRGMRFIEEEDVLIFFDKISGDLRKTMNMSSLRFDAEKDRISFAASVMTKGDKAKGYGDEEFVDEIGRVEYFYDALKHQILRRQANYSQALDQGYQGSRVLVNDVRGLTCTYFYETSKGFVEKEVAEGIVPSLIKIEIEFSGKQPKKMTKLISIPVGS